MIKIIICGIKGRMGRLIAQLADNDKNIKLVGGTEKPGDREYPDKLETIIEKADVVIDFTTPSLSIENLKTAAARKKAAVIGTTGFTEQQLTEIDKISREIPCVCSPNMSTGVNLMFNLVSRISEKLPDYDIEIIEKHHRRKKDAPSGTAKKIADNISKTLNLSPDKSCVHGRQGTTGERPHNQIGIHAVRAGDIVGEHTIIWAGPGETLELTHRALSRATFAQGALKAAKFAAAAAPGLYTMQDVLEQSKP